MNTHRIALLTYSTKPRGGVAHTLSLAKSLASLRHKVGIYALSSGEDFFKQVGVPYTLIPCPKRSYESVEEKVKDYINVYTEYLANNEKIYDIYHAEDCISANALFNLRERGIIKFYVRTIHHIDDFTSESLIDCQLNSILKPDYLIVVSKFWQRVLRAKYSLSSNVINNGVEVEKFRCNEKAGSKEIAKGKFSVEGKKVMLSIGGIEPRKNTITALRAFNIARAYFKAKGEKLIWIVGGGETLFDYRGYREEFYLEIDKLNLLLDRDVIILGNVPDSSMPFLYEASDVFVFPSLKEGWGLVVQEAMASAVPVIASDIEPMTEYLKNGDNSILIDPMDYKTLANEVIRIIENKELRTRIINKGKETAQAYSWKSAALKHSRYYSDILSFNV